MMKFQDLEMQEDSLLIRHSNEDFSCPGRYLKTKNNLSEIRTLEDKKEARQNLGISWENLEGTPLDNEYLGSKFEEINENTEAVYEELLKRLLGKSTKSRASTDPFVFAGEILSTTELNGGIDPDITFNALLDSMHADTTDPDYGRFTGIFRINWGGLYITVINIPISYIKGTWSLTIEGTVNYNPDKGFVRSNTFRIFRRNYDNGWTSPVQFIDSELGDALQKSIEDLKLSDEQITQTVTDAISDLLSEIDEVKDIVVYQIPSDFISQDGEAVEKEITNDVFQSIFGNIDEFVNNVKTKHIRLGIPYVVDDTLSDTIHIDVTSSISAKIGPTEEEVIEGINITGSYSEADNLIISVTMGIFFKDTDIMGSWIAQKETTPTEVKTELEEKINAILVDFGTVDIGNVYTTIEQWVRSHSNIDPLSIRIKSQFNSSSSELDTFVGTAKWVYGKGMAGAYNLVGSLSEGNYESSKLVEILVYSSGIVEYKNISASIIYNWDDLDLSVSEGTVSRDVYDNLLEADVVTSNGTVFNSKMVEGNSIILVFYNYSFDEPLVTYDAIIITVNSDLTYTAEIVAYNLPSEDYMLQELAKKQDVLNIYNIFNSYSWEDKGTLTAQTLGDLFLSSEVGYYQFVIDDRTYKMIKHLAAQEGVDNKYIALDITGNPTWGYITTDGYLGHWSFVQDTEPKIEDLISYQQIINEILSRVSDIVTYEIPSDWTEVGKQHEITQDNFHDIFGSEDELLKNLENKHVRLKLFGSDETVNITIDVTTSLQTKLPSETSVTYIINFNGNASADVEGFLTVHALDVRCGIGIEKNTDGTYSFIEGSFEIIQKENSVTTEDIADEAVTTEKIADKAITRDKIADGVLPQECVFAINQVSYDVTVIGTFNDKLSMVYPAVLEIEDVTEYGSFAYLPSERIGTAIFNQYSLGYEYKDGSFTLIGKLQHATGGGSGVADVGITGTLNVTDQNSIAAAQDLITKPYGVAFYLITDSNGRLPSKNQEAVHISASIEKLLSFRSPNTAVNNILNQVSIDNFKPRGFNVGDIIALSRVPVSIDALVEYLGLSSAIATALKLLGLSEIEIYQYKIWTTNDAKWSNFQNKDGSVVPTGVKGLMSVWDKEQVDKVPRLEANDLSTKYGYGTNFDDCLTTGVCAYSPANIGGVTENFTLIVQASSTIDSGGFYSIIQTAYGRTGSVYNRIFKRMIFYNPTTGAKEPHAWVEITGSSSSVFECDVAPYSVYTALSSNGVNGQARIRSEDGDYGAFVFTGDVFPFTDKNNDSLYIGVGFVYPDYVNSGNTTHTQAEPATLIAPNGSNVIIYRHTHDKITALEARIKALEDKLG